MDLLHPPIPDTAELRHSARRTLEAMPLVVRSAAGNRDAFLTLLTGFWPYVVGFERAIKLQSRMLVRRIADLAERYGADRIARYCDDIGLALIEMSQEEGSHALLWQASATYLDGDVKQARVTAGVAGLLGRAGVTNPYDPTLAMRVYSGTDPASFFALLAATEYIAEELSGWMCGSTQFQALVPANGWQWGRVHLVGDHEDGPTHRELDEDLAQAFVLPPVVSALIRGHFQGFLDAEKDIREMDDREVWR